MSAVTVWKFQIPISDTPQIEMPQGAQILHAAMQYNQPCIWARVDPTAPIETRYFNLRGTGHPNADGEHIGSMLTDNGQLVLHLFELRS